MTRIALALCTSLALAACSSMQDRLPPAPIAPGQNPAEAACLASQKPGASSPAFCQCIGNKVAYAAGNDPKMVARLARFAMASPNDLEAQRVAMAGRTSRAANRMGADANAWRVAMQNSQMRCAPHAQSEAPFFGFAY